MLVFLSHIAYIVRVMELANVSEKQGNCSVRQTAHQWHTLLCNLILEKIFAPEFQNKWVHAVV
jgi:hypothetical protein